MESSTWSVWNIALLAANVALPLVSLGCWWRRGSLKRLPLLRLYLSFSVLVSCVVPLVTLAGHLSRPQYRHLYTAVDIIANVLVCGIAWELTRSILPSIRVFISLWAGGLTLMLVLVYGFHVVDQTDTMLKLSILASFVAGGILAVCALMPLSFWSREYAAVAIGVVVLVVGNAVMALLQLKWVYQHFAFIRLAVPCVSLLSYASFLVASCSPQVSDAEHLGGYKANA